MTPQVSYTSRIAALLTLVLMLAGCAEQPAALVSTASSPTSISAATPVQSSPSVIASAPTFVATTTAEATANAPTTVPTSAATTGAETIAVAGIAAATPTPVLPTKLITDTTLTSLRPLREVGFGRAVEVAIAPDGKLLAVATTAGVALVDLTTLRPVRFDAIKGGAYQVAFSPDSKLLAASSTNDGPGSTTTVRQVADGKLLASVDGDKPLFSPDGQMLATDGSGDGHSSTALWKSTDGTQIDWLEGGAPVFSPDGQLIATAPDVPVDQPTITQLWRAADRTKLVRVDGTPLAFSPDGNTLATATEKDVRLWDAGGKSLHALATGAEPNTFLAAAFSVDGKQVSVIAGSDVQTWSVADGNRISTAQNLAVWDQQNDVVGPRTFSPYGTLLTVFATPIEGLISGMRLVRVSDQHVVYEDSISGTIAYSPDGALAATVSSDGLVHVISTSDGSATPLDMPGFSAVAFSPEGATLLTAGTKVYLWDVIKGSLERTLVSSNQYGLYGASRLQYSPDRRFLALETAFGAEGTLANDATVWDLQAGDTGQQVWEQTAFASSDLVSSFSPVGNASAWAHEGPEVHLQRSGGISLTLTMPVTVTALRFNPAGTLLASGDADGNIVLRDPAAPTSSTALQAGSSVQALEWSPDGTLLGARLSDGNLLVWRVGQQKPLVQLTTVADTARFIFSADNRLLIAGGSTGVTMFRLSDGQVLHTLPVAAQDLAIGPGRRLLAVLSDERVTLWGVE